MTSTGHIFKHGTLLTRIITQEALVTYRRSVSTLIWRGLFAPLPPTRGERAHRSFQNNCPAYCCTLLAGPARSGLPPGGTCAPRRCWLHAPEPTAAASTPSGISDRRTPARARAALAAYAERRRLFPIDGGPRTVPMGPVHSLGKYPLHPLPSRRSRLA